jgi:hypothetical protein
MRLEIATPHDRVVEVRVAGPLDDEGGSLIAWTLAAVPATSTVLLDLTRLEHLDEVLAESIDDTIRDLERRHVPVVVVIDRTIAVEGARVGASAALVLADVSAARECAVGLAR